MKRILTIVVFSIMFLSCESKVSTHNTSYISNYQQAILKVKKNNKIVMLKLTSEDCHFCKNMDKDVLSDEDIHFFISQHFILVDIDVKKEKLPLSLEYKVTPTFFFINSDEKIISKIQGSWNKKDFLELLEMVVKKVKGENR